VVALLGANGAGKITTLRTIVGVLKPMRGRVLFGGDDLAGPAGRRARAGGPWRVLQPDRRPPDRPAR
jgi:branched-chain amino acid transport system ATP-binding protein